MRFLFAVILLATSAQADWYSIQGERWSRAKIEPRHARAISRTVDRIVANAPRYKAVDAGTDVPWYAIAALHNMESGGSFRHHLHEGSPLSGRTRWVPKGRPKTGRPPFTWEESARDALLYDKLNRVAWSKLNSTLYACERYNGTGYLKYHKSTPSPYLWSGTSLYKRGKYVSDGKWSSTAVSKQIGVAAIFKEMENRKILNFSRLK